MTENTTIQIDKDIADKLTVHKNYSSDVIVVSAERLKLCIIDNKNAFHRKDEWVPPIGLTLSLLSTILFAEFKNSFLLPNVWQALYILAFGVSLYWAVKTTAICIKHRNRNPVNDIMRDLMSRDGAEAAKSDVPSATETAGPKAKD